MDLFNKNYVKHKFKTEIHVRNFISITKKIYANKQEERKKEGNGPDVGLQYSDYKIYMDSDYFDNQYRQKILHDN